MLAPATILYRRDLLGRLVAAGTSADPKAFGAWGYRGDGALATETLKAGEGAAIARSFATDGLGRPVSIDEPVLTQTIAYRKDGDAAKPYADGGIAAETVAYKVAGFPSGTIPPGSTTTYAYDGFGRLTTARSGERSVLNVDATYDGNGNLDSLAQAGASRAYDYHDGTNRLASVAGQTYANDAAGAVTSAAGTSLVRDPATGRMRRGTKGGQSLSVLRDGRGRIALTTQGTAKRLSLRDGAGTVLWEKDGTAIAMQVHGATGRIGLWTGTVHYAVAKDLRGSTRILSGSDGKAAAWLSYCAYGVLDAAASSSGTLTAAIRNRYTGQDWLEPLALYDYGARLYDPALGRFLSPDPADQTPSPYMYVAGDPVNGIDPDGRVLRGFIRQHDSLFFIGGGWDVPLVLNLRKKNGVLKSKRRVFQEFNRALSASENLDSTTFDYFKEGNYTEFVIHYYSRLHWPGVTHAGVDGALPFVRRKDFLNAISQPGLPYPVAAARIDGAERFFINARISKRSHKDHPYRPRELSSLSRQRRNSASGPSQLLATYDDMAQIQLQPGLRFDPDGEYIDVLRFARAEFFNKPSVVYSGYQDGASIALEGQAFNTHLPGLSGFGWRVLWSRPPWPARKGDVWALRGGALGWMEVPESAIAGREGWYTWQFYDFRSLPLFPTHA